MSINWEGNSLMARTRRAQISAIDTTMSAATLHARKNHSPGAHELSRFVSGGHDRPATRANSSGSLEGSIGIDKPGHRVAGGAAGRWGSKDIVYALRIELGFQGKDSLGRIIDQNPFPFLKPAADAEYPKLAKRIKTALRVAT